MTSITSSPTTADLLDHIIKGTAYGVSDGSYFPSTQTGSCAWIISTPNGQEYIEGGGLIPGEGVDQDPYRSELGGQLGLAAIATGIHIPAHSSPTLTIACDGLSALNQVGMDKQKIKAKMKHVDLISAISETWETGTYKLLKKHGGKTMEDTTLVTFHRKVITSNTTGLFLNY